MTEKSTDSVTFKQIMTKILDAIRAQSNCQSVGIRLHNNADYPYYVQEGFPGFFILKENSLCMKDSEGKHILDKRGSPLLECMCGNVIKGQFDPKLVFFTEKGSFWTNSTTHLLANTTEKERQSRTRNMCHNSGYESVALIPLRGGNGNVGLIQMNDPRENMFTAKSIKNYESLAVYVGEIISNALEIQKNMSEFSNMINNFESVKK